ncbi:hypothetical protein DK65_294 [Brucella pinnipedialis]|nr:hypothetical protein DK65_294 [Brucella pinnipedialis]ENR15046.1 hypothetical protein C066_00954 [Brucella sp. UK5/01]ENT15968.1 hypothetical protein C067_00981 [Brucella sp. F8/99]ENT23195.1 hypothetical protein C051_01058 [Brucella sp. UK40/99]KFJ48597.1 hypothetical protein DK52_512 [Brucella abortus]
MLTATYPVVHEVTDNGFYCVLEHFLIVSPAFFLSCLCGFDSLYSFPNKSLRFHSCRKAPRIECHIAISAGFCILFLRLAIVALLVVLKDNTVHVVSVINHACPAPYHAEFQPAPNRICAYLQVLYYIYGASKKYTDMEPCVETSPTLIRRDAPEHFR